MARKRRKKAAVARPGPLTDAPLVNPFREVRAALKAVVTAAPAPPQAAPAPAQPEDNLRLSEDDLFAMAMDSVAPLPAEGRVRVRPQPPWDERPRPRPVDEEVEFAAEMDEQDQGEWHAADVAEVDVDALRSGAIEVAKVLDLHGMRADTAQRAVAACLHEARQRGYVCVLMIHGKGQHSGSEGDVLRRGVRQWLRKRPMRDAVRAFTPARQDEGGSGATRVLVRLLGV